MEDNVKDAATPASSLILPDKIAEAVEGIDGILEQQKPCCKNCKHWRASGGVAKVPEGVCRRNPPLPFVVNLQQDGLGRIIPTVISQFPPITAIGLCGEFKLAREV